MKISIEKPAFLFYGELCGVIGTTDCETANELHDCYSKTVGHKTSLYLYGNEDIQGERIAICPGGGNAMFVINEMMNLTCTIYKKEMYNAKSIFFRYAYFVVR